MEIPKIERIRLDFLESLVKTGLYVPTDLVVIGTCEEGFPAVFYERDEYCGKLSKTRATFSLRGEKIGFIDTIHINKGLRNKGLATKIYNSIEYAYIVNGVDVIKLYARADPRADKNPSTFWKRKGFYEQSPENFEKKIRYNSKKVYVPL